MSGLHRAGSVLELSGPIHMANARRLLEEGLRLLAPDVGSPAVDTLDASGVTDVDSSAVALLLAWKREARRQGRTLAIVDLPDNIKSLATLYGVIEFL